MTLRVTGAAGQPAPVRSYSLSSAPGASAYRISVKRAKVEPAGEHRKTGQHPALGHIQQLPGP